MTEPPRESVTDHATTTPVHAARAVRLRLLGAIIALAAGAAAVVIAVLLVRTALS